jgi:Domain of unknown function (DUF4440)
MKYIITALFLFISCVSNGQAKTDPSVQLVKDAVWQLEERYWTCVRNENLTEYAKLWDPQFIGYPSNNKITDKEHITDWVKTLHADKNRTFTVELERKAENVFGDIVMVFYDTHYTYRNNKNEIIELEHGKITHTWRRTGDSWLIIGGMGATVSDKKN